MSDRTAIEWTDSTWIPIRARNLATGKVGWHCEHTSEACRFCYAEVRNKWIGTGLPYKPGHRSDVEIFLDEKMLLLPLKWKKPRRIFVCSMTDLFADFVTDEMIDRVFAVMALAPQHTFQVLTKRSGRMRAYCRQIEDEPHLATVKRMAAAVGPLPLNGDMVFPSPNVWLGVSAENQKTADERIPDLLQTPAAVRFVSLEPLLGPIRTDGWLRSKPHDAVLDWVIVGGESGPHARLMNPDWARSLRDQCVAAGVPFFFKQWGNWKGLDESTGRLRRLSKAEAGRELDGREWNEMPGRKA